MVIYRREDKYSISETCKFFSASRSGYYDYVKRMYIPAKELPSAEKIRERRINCGQTYGYRRVQIRLDRQGIYRNSKIILRVIQKYNLLSAVRRKKYRDYSSNLHKYPNLLNRDFHADRPNQKRVTDISYIHAKQGEYIHFYNNERIQLKTKLAPLENEASLLLNTYFYLP